jgi:hypothetical protein
MNICPECKGLVEQINGDTCCGPLAPSKVAGYNYCTRCGRGSIPATTVRAVNPDLIDLMDELVDIGGQFEMVCSKAEYLALQKRITAIQAQVVATVDRALGAAQLAGEEGFREGHAAGKRETIQNASYLLHTRAKGLLVARPDLCDNIPMVSEIATELEKIRVKLYEL